MVPRAKPRPRVNQPEITFIAGGYTPPKNAPVAKRAAINRGVDSSGITSKFVAAASSAEIANSVRALIRSERFVNEINSVPNTNPSWTATVRSAIDDSSTDFSISSAPDIALVENQIDKEKNVAEETSISVDDRVLALNMNI